MTYRDKNKLVNCILFALFTYKLHLVKYAVNKETFHMFYIFSFIKGKSASPAAEIMNVHASSNLQPIMHNFSFVDSALIIFRFKRWDSDR